MWWKIALVVVAIWLSFGLIVALIKGAFALLITGLIVLGAVSVYRWFADKGTSHDDVTMSKL